MPMFSVSGFEILRRKGGYPLRPRDLALVQTKIGFEVWDKLGTTKYATYTDAEFVAWFKSTFGFNVQKIYSCRDLQGIDRVDEITYLNPNLTNLYLD